MIIDRKDDRQKEDLISEIAELRNRVSELEQKLTESEQTLDAIHSGEVDAILVSTKNVFAPGASFGAYSASKTAAHQLERIASLELSSMGVRDNMVSPDAVFSSGARKYAEKGCFPGGAFDNQMHFGPSIQFDGKLDEPAQMLLFDPQTSGGLLLGVPPVSHLLFSTAANAAR